VCLVPPIETDSSKLGTATGKVYIARPTVGPDSNPSQRQKLWHAKEGQDVDIKCRKAGR